MNNVKSHSNLNNNTSVNVSWTDLQSALSKFNFVTPFQLDLADGQFVVIEQVIKLVPRTRLIGFGRWQSKSVFVKFFFDEKEAEKQMKADIAGVRLLQENKILTPKLYSHGANQDNRIHVLIFERIFNSKNLKEIWHNKKSVLQVLPILESVIKLIAKQHELGIFQRDLNHTNLLLTENAMYLVDGACIKYFSQPVSKEMSIKNIAKLFSYLGSEITLYQENLFNLYVKFRHWTIENKDLATLLAQIKKKNKKRWLKAKKNIYTDSRNFITIKNKYVHGVWNRNYFSNEMLELIHNPDMFLNHPTATLLTTNPNMIVMKVKVANHNLKVEKYHSVPWYQWFRQTPASVSWQLAHKSIYVGAMKTNPVAYVEKRRFNFARESYYVSVFNDES